MGSAEFLAEYNKAIESRKIPQQGLFFTLISEFKGSTEFQQLSQHTKRAYLGFIKAIENEFGDMPIAALDQKEVRGEFMRWRDTYGHKPRTADYAWTVLARILSFAKNRGRITFNHAERGGRLYKADRADKFWTEDVIGKFLATASVPLTRAFMMALWTGQRQGDLLTLPWSAYDGQKIRLRQSKTGRRVTIPVGEPLKAMLDSMKRECPVVLTNQNGKPWTSSGFRASWKKALKRARIEGLTFHDLRGSAVIRLALAEATVPEIATFTGHSLKDVEAILDAHYLGRDVRLAENAVRKLERGVK